MFGRGDLGVEPAEAFAPGFGGDQLAGVAASAEGRQEAFAGAVALEEHRQGQFAAGGVGTEGLARLGVILQQVNEVVVNLVGDTEVASEERARGDVFWRAAGEEGADVAGAFEEFSRLQADVAGVIFEGKIIVAA